jgi:hypothetical protein
MEMETSLFHLHETKLPSWCGTVRRRPSKEDTDYSAAVQREPTGREVS